MKDDRRRHRKPRAVLLPDTNPRRFVVTRRPRLSKLTDYPELDFADYERRLASLQGVLQLIQRDDEPRRTEAAHERVLLDESRLHGGAERRTDVDHGDLETGGGYRNAGISTGSSDAGYSIMCWTRCAMLTA